MVKIFLIFIVCLLCVGCAHRDPHALPEVFLGEWIHNEGYLLLTINADGTMVDRNRASGEVVGEFQYKVIEVDHPERVAIAFKVIRHYRDPAEWIGPWPSFLWLDLSEIYPGISAPRMHWGSRCALLSEEEWEDFEQHRDTVQSRIAALDPENSCVAGFFHTKYWPVDESKFD